MRMNLLVLLITILLLVYAPIELTRLIIWHYNNVSSSSLFIAEIAFIWLGFPTAIGLMIWQYFEAKS